MVYFMKQVHRGAGFKFTRAGVTGKVSIKQLSPVKKDMGSYAFNSSEFYKVMPEGEYSYSIIEKNKSAKTINVSIEKDSITQNGNYTVLD